jgi:hypothetical protein
LRCLPTKFGVLFTITLWLRENNDNQALKYIKSHITL